MKYLDRLRDDEKVFGGDTAPTKLTELIQAPRETLTKPTKAGFVSFAGAQPPLKTLSGSSDVTARKDADREARINQATRMLQEMPHRHSAFVTGSERDGLIPVTVVIRISKGFVTGDLVIPKDQWDPWLFLQFLREQEERAAS